MTQFYHYKKYQWLFACIWINIIGFGRSLQYDSITCTSNGEMKTHLIPENTLVHFQSKNFPENPDSVSGFSRYEIYSCNETFLTANPNNFLWGIIYNGDIFSTEFSDGIRNKRKHSFFILDFLSSTNTLFLKSYHAIEGTLWSFDPTETSCPFTKEVIEMKEGKIIPITSQINETEIQNNCTWKFFFNHETHELKIWEYLSSQRMMFLEEISRKNTTQCFKQVSREIHGTKEIISLQNDESNIKYIQDFEVGKYVRCIAFVSIVKKHPEYITTKCKHKKINESALEVFNNGYGNKGYGPYEKCEYAINIPKNCIMQMVINDVFMERPFDTLLLEKKSGVQMNVGRDNLFLNEKANGTILKFKSDGDIQDRGFNLTFIIIKKQCSNSQIIIPCNKKTTFTPFMNTMDLYKDMECNYTFVLEKGCEAYSYTVDIKGFARNENVIMKFYINGNFYNYSKYISLYDHHNWSIQFEEQFLSNETVRMKLIMPLSQSNIYSYGRMVISSYSNGAVTHLPTIYLKDDNVYPLSPMKKNATQSICVQDKNYILEAFIPGYIFEDRLVIYDSMELSSNLSEKFNKIASSNFFTNFLQHKISKSGCFTIHRLHGNQEFNENILFRSKPAKSKSPCYNFKTVFPLTNLPANITLYNNATTKCVIYFVGMSNNYKLFSNFSASENSSFVFQTIKDQKELFNLSSGDANLQNPVKLSTDFLNVLMSPMSKISFDTSSSWHYAAKIKKFSSGKLSLNLWDLRVLISDQPINLTFLHKSNQTVNNCSWKITTILNNTNKTSVYKLNQNSELTIYGKEFIVENECQSVFNDRIKYFPPPITSTIYPPISKEKNVITLFLTK